MSARPTLYQQTVGVFKKNVALKLEDRKKLAAEIGFPVYFAVILFGVLQPLTANLNFDFAGACSDKADANANCESAPSPLAPALSVLHPRDAPEHSCDTPSTPLSFLLYSPDDVGHELLMNDTLVLLNSSLSCAKGFPTRDAAEAWYLSHGPAVDPSAQGGALPAVAAAVFFDPASKADNRSFTISFPQQNREWCSVAGGACPRWGGDFPDARLSEPLTSSSQDTTGSDLIEWTTSLSLQWALTRALAMNYSSAVRDAIEQGRANGRVPTPPVLAKLPIPPLRTAFDPTLNAVAITVPIVIATM